MFWILEILDQLFIGKRVVVNGQKGVHWIAGVLNYIFFFLFLYQIRYLVPSLFNWWDEAGFILWWFAHHPSLLPFRFCSAHHALPVRTEINNHRLQGQGVSWMHLKHYIRWLQSTCLNMSNYTPKWQEKHAFSRYSYCVSMASAIFREKYSFPKLYQFGKKENNCGPGNHIPSIYHHLSTAGSFLPTWVNLSFVSSL